MGDAADPLPDLVIGVNDRSGDAVDIVFGDARVKDFLQPVFNTIPLNLQQWSVIAPLILIPSVAAEVTKLFLRMAHTPETAPSAA